MEHAPKIIQSSYYATLFIYKLLFAESADSHHETLFVGSADSTSLFFLVGFPADYHAE